MKPAHERNQECLPPKKRDLPVSSGAGEGEGGEDPASTHSSSSTSRDTQSGGAASAEWMRVQPGVHYSVENSDGVGMPVDQYGMLYKVALPSVTYSPTSLHPVLSHISPAYTVPSSILQHPGIPYPPLGYAHIPHSSLQFISSPYAVPYGVPPGFVPSSLISPQSAVPQPHHVSHLVPYPSVIQEGMVSPPPQPVTSAHAFGKVAAGSSLPVVLSPEQAAQQHLGSTEVNPRGVPVFYHQPSSRAAQPPLGAGYRDAHGSQQEREKKVNGAEEEQGGRDLPHESAYSSRSTRILHVPPSSVNVEHPQDRMPSARRFEERGSPGLPNTPDADLEVQQVVGRLSSNNQAMTGICKEASLGPLNLSQGTPRDREALLGSQGDDVYGPGRTAYVPHPAGPDDSRAPPQQQQPTPHHAVVLANGQPVLVPLDYHHQSRYLAPPSDAAISIATSPKAPEPPARTNPSERAMVELEAQLQQPQRDPASLPAPGGLQTTASGPSHFTKGAIIQLATGELKRVEDLQTQDFVRSAEVSGGLKIDSSMVVDIRKSQRPGLVSLHFSVGEQQSKVAIDVPPEHPFFVFGQGWSSCSPDRTAQLYGLACHHLQAGDVCVSITLQQQQQKQQQQQQQLEPQHQQTQARTSTKAGSTPAVAFRPMGPPAPQHLRPPAHFRAERTQQERERRTGEEEEVMQAGGSRHGEMPCRPDRTSAEHTRSRGSYCLHSEVSPQPAVGTGEVVLFTPAAQRRWSAPGFQRYEIKCEEAVHSSASSSSSSSSSSSRPSFIPQEVKLSIEGRSNAGK